MQINLSGELPTGDVILASCDRNYYHRFGIPLAYSCNAAGNNLHLHVINPEPVDFALYAVASQDMDIKFTMSGESGGLATPGYYSCNRFIIAPHLLKNGVSRLLIIDTDCLLMNHFDFPDAELGLFLRNPLTKEEGDLKDSTSIAAGLVYYTKASLAFAEEVSRLLLASKLNWYIDQVTLWKVFQEHEQKLRDSGFHQFGIRDMDWEHGKAAKIWTAKGKKKYKDEEYLAEQQKYLDQFEGLTDRFWQ